MTYVELDATQPIWDRFLWVAPIVVIGTVDADGSIDFAPKHMATPLGWENYFGFVCTPRHATYRNALRERAFTVSYPTPGQLVHTSLTAGPRCEDGQKGSLSDVPRVASRAVVGWLMDGAYVHLECELERTVDGFGENGLVIGKVVAARVQRGSLRVQEREDQRLVREHPLLAYLSPGQFAHIDESHPFPLPAGFSK